MTRKRMWPRIFRKHCSDDLLVGYLDGELSLVECAAVSRHWKRCWQCRARLADLEQQAERLGRAHRMGMSPAPEQMRAVFAARREIFERELEAVPPMYRQRTLRWRIATAFVFTLLAGLCTATLLHLVRSSPAPARISVPKVGTKQTAVTATPALPNPPLLGPHRELPPTEPVRTRRRDAINLFRTEVEAHYVLHRAAACLSGSVEITRTTSDVVEIHGVAESSERRQQLIAMFADLASRREVHVAITSPEEHEPPPAQLPRTEARLPEVRSGRLPIQDLLESQLSRGMDAEGPVGMHQRIVTMAREMVDHSDAALEHAWALRRLTELARHAPAEAPPAESLWLLEIMVRDHQSELRKRTSGVRHLGSAILPAVLPAAEVCSGGNWSTLALATFDRVRDVDDIVHVLFAGAGLGEETLQSLLPRLSGALYSLDGCLPKLETALNQEFRGHPGQDAASTRPH